MTDPARVAVAGDWHGDGGEGDGGGWAPRQVRAMAARLEHEPVKIILQAGDFGIWPGDAPYLHAIQAALDEAGAYLDFVDGNHEDHARLAEMLACINDGTGPHGVTAIPVHLPGVTAPRIRWLPRGTRWHWHGRNWLAAGGATSVDKPARIEGVNWWPGEAITAEQEQMIKAGGHAAVVLAHDCPASVALPLGPPPSWWDMEPAYAHRRAMQRIADAVTPAHWIHGHYHLTHDTTTLMSHGPVTVTGLNMNREPGNWRILDTQTMQWEK